MTTVFSPFMVTQMAAGMTWTGSVGLVLLYNAPALPTGAPNDTQGLLNLPGFQEVAAAACPTYVPFHNSVNEQPVSATTTAGVTTVNFGADWSPIPATSGAKPVYVAAALWYYVGSLGGVTNPWIMMSTDMFGIISSPGLRVTASQVPRVLLSYAPRGSGATVDVVLGPIVQSPGTLTWESARIQHVYLYPQRINWLPNPSFEDTGNFGWRSDGTMTRMIGGVDNPANHFLRVTGGSSVALESIAFPHAQTVRFSAFVRSQGAQNIWLNMLNLDDSYTITSVAQGAAQAIHNDWTRLDEILVGSDISPAHIPQIMSNGSFDIDLCLLESTPALHAYFDGDSLTGLPGDFSWQRGEAQSYSFWYSNRYVTAARLFGTYIDGQLVLPSLVQDWVPASTSLWTHWNVLSPFDTKHPLEDWPLRTIPPVVNPS